MAKRTRKWDLNEEFDGEITQKFAPVGSPDDPGESMPGIERSTNDSDRRKPGSGRNSGDGGK